MLDTGDILNVDYMSIDKIEHDGDTNTYIEFQSDDIIFYSGTKKMLSLDEGSNSYFKINPLTSDIDLWLRGDNDVYLLYTDASADMVGIGTSTPSQKLEVVGNITADYFLGDGSLLTGIDGMDWSTPVDADIIPDGANIYDIGNSTNYFKTTYGNMISAQQMYARTNSNTYVNLVGDALTLRVDGTNILYADKSDGYAYFNPYGHDMDYIFEGDTDTSLLFTDASADKVGIGTSTPSTKLDVNGDVTADTYFGDGSQLTGISADNCGTSGICTNLYTDNYLYHTGDTDTYMYFSPALDKITFRAGGIFMFDMIEGDTDQVVVNDASGNVNFRVETNTDQYAIFTNASTDNVGIGTSTPASKLDVQGNVTIGTGLIYHNGTHLILRG
jgi:hypothetical protein